MMGTGYKSERERKRNRDERPDIEAVNVPRQRPNEDDKTLCVKFSD